MQLKAKNREVIRLIHMDSNAPKDQIGYMGWYDELSTYDRDRIVLAGFFNGFEGICETINLNMDLSYETVGNMGDALIANYIYHKNVDKISLSDNLDLIAHCLAAYLSFLAMNEHNCELETKPYNTSDKSYHPNYLWADFLTANVSGLRTMDFLPTCMKAIVKPNENASYDAPITIDLTSIIDRYKRLTNADLSELGMPTSVILTDKE